MPLTISSPHLERRLAEAAQEQHTTPAALAVQMLETLLVSSEEAVSGSSSSSSSERKALFHRWLEHNQAQGLPSLSPQAFERVSFYDDERHLHASSS